MKVHETRNQPSSREVNDGGIGVAVLPHPAHLQDSITRKDNHSVTAGLSARAVNDRRVLQCDKRIASDQFRPPGTCSQREDYSEREQSHCLGVRALDWIA